MAWPPDLAQLKDDAGITDSRDDVKLTTVLAAAAAFVARVHAGRYNFTGELGATVPEVPSDIVLGTIRLASRWHTRRRSPDALIEMGELGSGRVPSFDPDIDRMLRIGRHVRPRVG